MSQFIAGNNSALIFAGAWAPANVGGVTFNQSGNFGDTFIAGVTDTDCYIKLFSGSSYTITVDGTPTTVTASGVSAGGSWVWQACWTGQSNTARELKVTGPYIATDQTLQLTNTGTVQTAPNYDATTIWVFAYGQGGKLALLQDNISIGTATPSGAGSFELLRLGSGLSGTHAYEILNYSIAVNANYIHGIIVGGVYYKVGTTPFTTYGAIDGSPVIGTVLSNYLLTPHWTSADTGVRFSAGNSGLVLSATASRSTAAAYGTSIIDLSQDGMTDSRQGDPYQSAHPVSLASSRWGHVGANYSTFLRDHTSDVTSLSPKPVVVLLDGPINDQNNGVTVGSVGSAGTFTGDYKTTLTNLNTGLANGAVFLCRQSFDYGASASGGLSRANRTTYSNAQIAAINSYNGGSPSCVAIYIPTDGWVIPAALHPTASEEALIANRQIPILASIQGTAYTTSGTTGTVTVTLAGGATFTGEATTGGEITLTASAGTITATAASGTITNNGTGTVTVRPASGATSFTYTASATATITYTNNQAGWTNPAATSYVAVSPYYGNQALALLGVG